MQCAHCLSVQKCRVGLGKCAHCLSVQCSLGKCGYWDHLGAHLHPPAQSQKKNLKKNHKKNLKKKSKKKILRPPWSSFTFTSTCSSFLHCSSCKDSSPDYFGIKIFTIVQLTIIILGIMNSSCRNDGHDYYGELVLVFHVRSSSPFTPPSFTMSSFVIFG